MQTSSLKTVRNDFGTLVKDAQELLREATSTTGEKAEELRNKGLALLDVAMTKAHEVQVVAVETGKEIAKSTDDFVQEHPWKAAAISAGVGMLLGMLIARK